MSAWTELLEQPARAAHAAQVYADVSELAASVSVYLAAGFELGEPAVVIVTPANWRAVEDELSSRGWSPSELETSGLLRLFDAESTLASLLVRDHPSPGRFLDVVGTVLDELADRFPGRQVRAFGEMVDLLSKRGDVESAAELEDLWNALLHTRRFSLLCGYQADVFDRGAQASLLPDVCRAHSHVHPAADPAVFHQAVDGALAEVLGHNASKVYALTNMEHPSESAPIAERALMWLSSEMPAHAERILALARTRYAEAA